MTIEPENSPDVPIPATARPTIKAVDVGATAQIKLPNSKMATAIKNIVLTLKLLYSLPYSGCSAVVVSRYALPYQPMSLVLLNCAVMAPKAGAMMVWSRATRRTARQREVMIRILVGPCG